MSMLVADGLTHRFGSERALDNVDLVLDTGEHMAVLGNNGAGKTTLLRILATALRPTSGRLTIAGLDAFGERRRLRHARPRARQQAVPPHAGFAPWTLARHCHSPPSGEMNPFRVALAVARKDLRSEWRTREVVPALAQFIILALLIGNFGFQVDSRNAASIAPGILWLALVFAGLVAFGRTFAAEREQASLEAMLMTPASPVAIFAGKAVAATLLLIACEAVMLPALSLFFGTPFSADVVAAVLIATVGMAALGCLFAAMVARVRARELLLPLLTLPLWIPFIIAGGQAVQSAMGLPGSYSEAISLLIDFDILFLVLTSLAARSVLDE